MSFMHTAGTDCPGCTHLRAQLTRAQEELKALQLEKEDNFHRDRSLIGEQEGTIQQLRAEIARLRGYVQHKSGCATSFSVSGNPEPFGITLPLPCSCGLNIDPLIPHAHQGAL